MNPDWRDGFLFVGNQLSLDFLNTRPVVDGDARELLPDAPALARWMNAAGLIPAADAKRLEKDWFTESADRMHVEVQEFRERLRDVVLAIEGGGAPSSGFIAEVNLLLLAHPYLDQIATDVEGFVRMKRFKPRAPLDIFAPLMDSVASLLTSADSTKLRKCESCVLHFYDTSKKGTRRWCSMNACGNRAKVAAYTRRKRAATAAAPA